MIVYLILNVILTCFAGLDHLIMPVLPSGLLSVFTTVVRYMQNGLNFVFTFLDKNYCSQLFSWWITFGSIILSYEMILSVWHLITGNSHTQPVTYDGSYDSITFDGDGVVTSETHTSWSRRKSK